MENLLLLSYTRVVWTFTYAICSSLVTSLSLETHSVTTFNKKLISECLNLDCKLFVGLISKNTHSPVVLPKLHSQSCLSTYSSEAELVYSQHTSLKSEQHYLVTWGLSYENSVESMLPVKLLKYQQTPPFFVKA